MTLNEKADAIKYLKSIVVKSQKYEFAAWLRDREKEILSQLSQLNLPMNNTQSISHSKYLHLIEIVEKFESVTGYNESDIKEYLHKCISFIREEKLDKLFGDE